MDVKQKYYNEQHKLSISIEKCPTHRTEFKTFMLLNSYILKLVTSYLLVRICQLFFWQINSVLLIYIYMQATQNPHQLERNR